MGSWIDEHSGGGFWPAVDEFGLAVINPLFPFHLSFSAPHLHPPSNPFVAVKWKGCLSRVYVLSCASHLKKHPFWLVIGIYVATNSKPSPSIFLTNWQIWKSCKWTFFPFHLYSSPLHPPPPIKPFCCGEIKAVPHVYIFFRVSPT